jgi:molybdenum cofactor biosynthesis enzyme MoaA
VAEPPARRNPGGTLGLVDPPAIGFTTRRTSAERSQIHIATRRTDELQQTIRDAVWRKELKHNVNDVGFKQPRRAMRQIGG